MCLAEASHRPLRVRVGCAYYTHAPHMAAHVQPVRPPLFIRITRRTPGAETGRDQGTKVSRTFFGKPERRPLLLLRGVALALASMTVGLVAEMSVRRSNGLQSHDDRGATTIATRRWMWPMWHGRQVNAETEMPIKPRSAREICVHYVYRYQTHRSKKKNVCGRKVH